MGNACIQRSGTVSSGYRYHPDFFSVFFRELGDQFLNIRIPFIGHIVQHQQDFKILEFLAGKAEEHFLKLTQSVPYRSDDHRDQRFFRIRQTDFLVFSFHCAVNMKKLCFLKAVKQRGKVCQIRSRFF